MRKEDLAVIAVLRFLYLLIGSFFAFLSSVLLLFFVEKVIGDLPYFKETVLQAVFCNAVFLALLVVLIYKEGYREATWSAGGYLLSGGIALVPFLGLGMLLRFHPIVAVGVRYFAGILAYGSGFSSPELVYKLPFWLQAVLLLGYAALAMGIFLGVYRIGYARRMRDRAELMGSATTQN
jgi:hypothetical protein